MSDSVKNRKVQNAGYSSSKSTVSSNDDSDTKAYKDRE